MPGDDGKPHEGSRRGAHLRTKPLDDSNQFREALQAELRKHARPTLLVVAGPDVGMRIRLDRSLEIAANQRDVVSPVDLAGLEHELLVHQPQERGERRDRGGHEVPLDARDRGL